jgi:hypothetical protein
VLRVHRRHADTVLFQNGYSAIQYTPVACRPPYGSGTISTIPLSRSSRRPATEFPHRMLIPIRRHGHKAALIAGVDSSGVGVNDRQTGIAAATRRPNSRRCARFISPVVNRSKVDIFRFAMSYSSSRSQTQARLAKK